MKNFSNNLFRPLVLVFLCIMLPSQSLYSDSNPPNEDHNSQINLNKINKIAATTKIEFSGKARWDNFGYSAANAGDVNGDGYDDVVVGAFANDTGGDNAGQAYLFFGGPTPNTSPDVTFSGKNAGDYFGYSVSGAGDVNGDGYADVIIGAHRNNDVDSLAGKAYIFFGGTKMNNIADIVLAGKAKDNHFGRQVSNAGDMNGDGYDDVIVGAYGNKTGGTLAGQAYVYFGGLSMDTKADLTMTGENIGDHLGIAVSGAGDVNGDGYSDIIIGAFQNNDTAVNAGKAYLYFGSSSPDSIADVSLYGENAQDLFGTAVSGAGDINGDGFDDVIVGADNNDDNGDKAGKAYVYFGGSSMDNVADFTKTGQAEKNNFGIAVSDAGDINGDGYADIIISAKYNDDNGTNSGRAYVFYGSNAMNENMNADIIKSGSKANDYFGVSVSGGGDFNGDGYADIIIGANGNDDNVSDAGKVFVFCFTHKGTDFADMVFCGEKYDDEFARIVASAGDVNGDGYDDIIIGADKFDFKDQTHAGKAYVYFGGPNMDKIPDLTMTGEAASNYFGCSVASAGDVNGDGFIDIVIGAWGIGKSYIYFGGSSMDTIPDIIMEGQTYASRFGHSVASAGDVNGDGYCDVIIGAVNDHFGGTNSGSAYIYFGGASMDNEYDVVMHGQAAYDNFGYSVSTAGDVNGDGYDDIIIGAIYYDINGIPDIGKAYIYFGGTSMDNVVDLSINGEYTYSFNFGRWVATIGDVNRDGYDDIVVGAKCGSGNNGRAYIYFGGSIMDNNYDILFIGNSPGDMFGVTVGAGEFNGDGYRDIISGARGDDDGGTNAGKAFIYFGSILIDDKPDVIITGDNANNYFGRSVASAGDVNGDGLDDVLVGAYGANNSTGKAYLYLSNYPEIHPNIYFTNYDQESKITLKWGRCAYDNSSENRIKKYIIQRSAGKTNGQYNWQDITEIAAKRQSYYSYTDETDIQPSKVYHYRVQAVSVYNEVWNSNVRVVSTSGTGIKDQDKVPAKFALFQNYPNPFNPTTTISYQIPSGCHVEIIIYNMLGEKVSTLVSEKKPMGAYYVKWNASKLPSGIYLCRIQTDQGFSDSKKLVLLR